MLEILAASAALKLVALNPLTVRGVGFTPGESIRLLVTADQVVTRSLKAGPRGGFLVKLPVRLTDRCSSLVVQAIGSRGHRAMVDRTAVACDPDPGNS